MTTGGMMINDEGTIRMMDVALYVVSVSAAQSSNSSRVKNLLDLKVIVGIYVHTLILLSLII
jgi:hypothetical protein